MFYPNTFFLSRRLKFKQADLVHYHSLHGYYFNLLALPLLTKYKPSIWTFHDMWPILGHAAHSLDCERCEAGKTCQEHKNLPPKLYTWDSSAFLYKIKRYILLRSNFDIVVPSQWLQKKVEQSFLSHKPIHLIYNGIDVKTFTMQPRTAMRAKLNLPQNKKIIVFLAFGGLNNPWKGIKHIQYLLNKFSDNKDILFLSIGGINPEFTHFPNLQQIDYISDKAQLAEYYSAGDLFLSPSIAENFSLAILEAMACGLPPAVFKIGGMPEIIEHKVNGYLAKQHDQDDLVQGVTYILNNNKQTMSEKARTKIVNNFTLEKMVDGYEQLYKKLLNSKQ